MQQEHTVLTLIQTQFIQFFLQFIFNYDDIKFSLITLSFEIKLHFFVFCALIFFIALRHYLRH